MARDTDGFRTPAFGRIDPYCWLAVVPMLMVAVFLIATRAWIVGVGLVVLAAGVVVFDSWVNRPRPLAHHQRMREQRAVQPRTRYGGASSRRSGSRRVA